MFGVLEPKMPPREGVSAQPRSEGHARQEPQQGSGVARLGLNYGKLPVGDGVLKVADSVSTIAPLASTVIFAELLRGTW